MRNQWTMMAAAEYVSVLKQHSTQLYLHIMKLPWQHSSIRSEHHHGLQCNAAAGTLTNWLWVSGCLFKQKLNSKSQYSLTISTSCV